MRIDFKKPVYIYIYIHGRILCIRNRTGSSKVGKSVAVRKTGVATFRSGARASTRERTCLRISSSGQVESGHEPDEPRSSELTVASRRVSFCLSRRARSPLTRGARSPSIFTAGRERPVVLPFVAGACYFSRVVLPSSVGRRAVTKLSGGARLFSDFGNDSILANQNEINY